MTYLLNILGKRIKQNIIKMIRKRNTGNQIQNQDFY